MLRLFFVAPSTTRCVALLCAVAWLSACGQSASRDSRQPSWRQKRGSDKPVVSGPITIRLAPDGPAASAYNDPPITEPPSFPLSDKLIALVGEISAEVGKPAPAADGRLYAAAQQLAEVTPADAPLVYSLIEFALQRNGIIEPSPHLVVIWGPTDDQEIINSLSQRLPTILSGSSFTRMGVGVAEREDDQEVTVLAFQTSAIDTRPIPRRLSQGGRHRIEAVVRPPYGSPEAFVTRQSGDVERLETVTGPGGKLAIDFACGRHIGRNQIEVTASDVTGSTVLANFPLWCGSTPPAELTVEIDEAETVPVTSTEDAETRLLAMLNRDRQRHGLAPLALDERVSVIARKHSQEMFETGVVAHLSPTTGSAADRVKAGGVSSAVVLENVARAYGVAEAQEGLMNSPGHRANILSRDATHVGIGVVLGQEVAGSRELFVTQLFTRKGGPFNRVETHKVVRQRLHKARDLREDARLSTVAQQMADAIGKGQTPAQASQAGNQKLDESNLSYAKVTTLVTTVADLSAFEPAKNLTDASIRSFGVGVAQGDHAVMGEDAIHIVILLGHQ